MSFEIKSTTKVSGGSLIRCSHASTQTNTTMTMAVYIPHRMTSAEKVPYILYLSGLTCTDENVCQKSGVFKSLAELGIAFVVPDTSPRGEGVATAMEGEAVSWDFGIGAGFYLDAVKDPFSTHYRMYTYITEELPSLLTAQFTDIDVSKYVCSISFVVYLLRVDKSNSILAPIRCQIEFSLRSIEF